VIMSKASIYRPRAGHYTTSRFLGSRRPRARPPHLVIHLVFILGQIDPEARIEIERSDSGDLLVVKPNRFNSKLTSVIRR
jgi:hypothetical protein